MRRPGQVAALNAGLAAVEEDVVAITDDDSVPRPDWLARIAARFEREPAVGAVGGRDWVRHGGEPVHGRGGASSGASRGTGASSRFHHLGVGPARDVEFLKGANMAYRRTALPGFDTALRGQRRRAPQRLGGVAARAPRRLAGRL